MHAMALAPEFSLRNPLQALHSVFEVGLGLGIKGQNKANLEGPLLGHFFTILLFTLF